MTPVAASFHYLVQSPNPLHLGLECSVCSNGLGTLMCSTPHSTNMVSEEQAWSNVCNVELRSLCSYARKACIYFSPSFLLSYWLSIFYTHINTSITHEGGKKMLLPLKCPEKLLKVAEVLHYARKASLSSFCSTLFLSLPLYLLCLFAAFQPR